jgi:hypothetical protein
MSSSEISLELPQVRRRGRELTRGTGFRQAAGCTEQEEEAATREHLVADPNGEMNDDSIFVAVEIVRT